MAGPLGDLLSDGLAAPLGAVIAAVGHGVADAQAALDAAALAQTLAIYNTEGDAGLALLREIGYRPTFYVLPETTCEVQVSMRVGGSGGPDGSAGGGIAGARTYITPIDAGFASRYNFQADAAAKLTFKIVPVPPPAALDDVRQVPGLTGRAAGTAVASLEGLGFVAVAQGADGKLVAAADLASMIVTAQDSAPLTLRPIGATITLTVVTG